MNNTYINIHLNCPSEIKEILMAEISDFNILGIIENENDLEVSFNKDEWENSIKTEFIDLINKYENTEIISEKLIEERNWNEEWEKDVPAIHINNNVGIAPKWKLNELTEKYKIEINPKMSFGTGSHATTRLMCDMMSELDFNDKTVIDAGTGTGVLAIYSIMLGASRVLAFDNNEWSVQNSKENFEINNTSSQIDLQLLELDELDSLPPCHILLANILAPVIKRNMKKFTDAIADSNGVMLLSGILSEEKESIIETANDNGLVLVSYKEEDEWAGFLFERKK